MAKSSAYKRRRQLRDLERWRQRDNRTERDAAISTPTPEHDPDAELHVYCPNCEQLIKKRPSYAARFRADGPAKQFRVDCPNCGGLADVVNMKSATAADGSRIYSYDATAVASWVQSIATQAVEQSWNVDQLANALEDAEPAMAGFSAWLRDPAHAPYVAALMGGGFLMLATLINVLLALLTKQPAPGDTTVNITNIVQTVTSVPPGSPR